MREYLNNESKKIKVSVIGLGRMGRCLISGLIESGKYKSSELGFTTSHAESLEKAKSEFSAHPFSNNQELVENSETVVMAVKPQTVDEVLEEVGKAFTDSQTLISIAASVTISRIEAFLGSKVPVVRAMPNTPVFVREGITAACLNAHGGQKDWERTEAIFSPLGKLVRTEEKHMDAVTGLSGSGPAYIYMVMESLTEGGIKVGLPRDLASLLASQTVLGAAKMLQETGRHPAALKDEVTTPAGCTIDGLLQLEEGKLRVTLMKAVQRATERVRELAAEAKKS